jgi:hypothetical protein
MFRGLEEALATFDHHQPDEGQIFRIQRVREAAKNFVRVIWESSPNSADRTAAIRYAHEAMMTANKSIILNSPKPLEE